jgi:uncharacterized protein (DUF4213/DUF364 family)
MTVEIKPSILERTRSRFREIVEQNHLLGASVTVLAKPLTPEEAIGTPGRRDFPIVIGRERVVESSVLGSRGHAFTDSPREFAGTLEDVLDLELTSHQSRAVYVATLNAVLNHLGIATGTVHCRDDDPEQCAAAIAQLVLDRHGRVEVGLIGFNPAIAERLIDTFGAEHVRISDLNGDNIGGRRFGVEIWDAVDRTEDLIDSSDVVVFTGTSLVNDTFDHIWHHVQARGKHYLVYGVTAAGVSELVGIERICPRGRNV